MSLPLPPRWLRRGLVQPLFLLVGAGLFLALLPIALPALLRVLAGGPGPGRALRLLAFGFVYLALELVVVTIAFGAWLASGFGGALRRAAFIDFHYRLVAVVIEVLHRVGARAFVLSVELQAPILLPRRQPLLLLSRHAGPGDSLLLLRQIFARARRRPRIVLKHSLQWDPMIDLVFNRLPMVFVDPRCSRQAAVVARIGQLAATMQAQDALLIFPEGRKVTPHRRRCAIERLRRTGREQAARDAERIQHLMLPRLRGLQAALQARPDLDVVLVAHTGLDELNTAAELWRAVPNDKTLRLRWQAFPAAGVPKERADLAGWMFAQWRQMDRWVAAQRASAGAGAAGAAKAAA